MSHPKAVPSDRLSGKSAIFRRNSFYFLTSFCWTATLSVVPQQFFLSWYPHQKQALLGFFLLAGTVAAVVGIMVSRKAELFSLIGNNRRQVRGLSISCLGLAAASFAALLLARSLWIYFTCYVLFKFISNFFYDFIDRYLVRATCPADLPYHVQSNLLFQLLGIMLAPFYFAAFPEAGLQNSALVLGICSVAALLLVRRLPSPPEATSLMPDSAPVAPPRSDIALKWFIAFTAVVLAAITMLMSVLAYVLHDYYGFADGATKGGLMIGVISISAVFGVFFAARFHRHHDARSFATGSQIAGSALFACAIASFELRFTRSFGILLTIGALAGIAYGLFLSTTRQYASARSSDSPNLLSVYNNLPNWAALASFSMVVLAARIAPVLHMDFCVLMLRLIGSVFLLSIGCLLVFQRITTVQSAIKGEHRAA